MIQFNLLPDVKLEYIKAQRTRQTVMLISVILSISSIALFLVFFGFNQIEKKHLGDLTKDITTDTSQLKAKPHIDKILTLQNQLNSLTDLHEKKPLVNNLFAYLNQVTPDKLVSITSMNANFTANTVSLTGTADSLTSVNKFVDTLKFSKYCFITDPKNAPGVCKTPNDATNKQALILDCADPKQANNNDCKHAFTSIVLSAFAFTTATTSNGGVATDQPATYTIDFAYDPNIFDVKQTIRLDVPNIITTRSEVDRPTDLFRQAPTTTKTTTTTTTKAGSN